MKELVFSSGLHRATIREHLDTLSGAGIVETIEFLPGEQTKGQPSKFYAVTNDARELFNQNDVFLRSHLRDLYDQVDKPDEIEQAEAVTRPDQ